jgi:hypothetical protein
MLFFYRTIHSSFLAFFKKMDDNVTAFLKSISLLLMSQFFQIKSLIYALSYFEIYKINNFDEFTINITAIGIATMFDLVFIVNTKVNKVIGGWTLMFYLIACFILFAVSHWLNNPS